MRVLQFTEWDRGRVVSLSDNEAQIVGRLERALTIRDLGNKRYKLSPKPGYVGSAQLSRDTVIIISPRMPLTSFAELISLAYQRTTIPTIHEMSQLTESASLTTWFFIQFLAEAQRLIRSGIRRDYMPVTEDRFSPRGRLYFNGRSPSITGSHLCSTDDFTKNSRPNRALKALLTLAIASVDSHELRLAFRQLMTTLIDVENTALSTAVLEAVLSNTLYANYSRVFRLGQLLVRNKGVDFGPGSIEASGFFFKLFELFELALFNSVREAAVISKAEVLRPRDGTTAKLLAGAPALGIRFQPDIGLKAQPSFAVRTASNSWMLVADAKYRAPIEGRFGKAFSNSNVYQIMAYAKVFCAPGALVYPKHDEDIDVTYQIGSLQIRILTVDLRGPESVRKSFSEVANKLLTFAS